MNSTTTESTAENPRPRGRPRSEKARTAILTAAIELLLEQGLHAMSMDDVARRAEVEQSHHLPLVALQRSSSRSTPWPPPGPRPHTRHPTRHRKPPRRPPGAGFRSWLRQLKQKPYGRVIAGLVAEAQTDPEFGQLYRQHFVKPRRAATRHLLQRAIERREIPADTNLDVTLDLLYGPIYHRLLHGHAPSPNTSPNKSSTPSFKASAQAECTD